MADLVGIYERMVAKLEAQLAAAKTDGVRRGIEGLLEGARNNLENARRGE